MASDEIISFNLKCNRCGYNLRGLPVGHRCPECGKPAPPGIATAVDLEALQREAAAAPIAAAVGCTVDALLFVLDCYRLADELKSRSFWTGAKAVTADEICCAARLLVREHFKDQMEAVEQLDSWGIHTTADIGRIVHELVVQGYLWKSREYRGQDLGREFTVAELFSSEDK
jgi:uncharacterized repeat protein (TIGR04138 family)